MVERFIVRINYLDKESELIKKYNGVYMLYSIDKLKF